MRKRRILAIVLTIVLVTSMSGCQWIRDYATQTNELPSAVLKTPGSTPVQTEEALIPLDVFTGYVEYTPPKISPDGSMILYRHMTAYTDSLIAENWKTGKKTVIPWPEQIGIPYFYWAPDGENVLFFIDDMGDENFGVYTTNIATGDSKTIVPAGDNDCHYVAKNPENDKDIYIIRLVGNYYDLYLLNYETGDLTLVLRNPGNITDYTFDYEGNLRLVTTTDENAGKHVWEKTGKSTDTTFSKDGWKEILSWLYTDADSSGAWAVMPDGKSLLYEDSSANNTSTLYSYDLGTGEKTEIFNDPDYDIGGTWTDLELSKVTAVSVYAQKNEWHVLDESFRDDCDILSSVGEDFNIFDSSANDEYWLVSYTSDIKEQDYYIYDMAAKTTKFLFNAEPDLENYEFSNTTPFSYTASDGLKIEGYATFPVGEGSTNLPTVMLVHGGPAFRDAWGFDPEVQLLASRGYLVLQVNFRGSIGYGKDFMHAGDKEWGGKMHQDILDAVEYAVGQGWTDPQRVGVYGASYGGYEALVCAAFSSDVFQCVVDAFGPSDLALLIESTPARWTVDKQNMINSVGDPVADAQMMKERSPLYYADQVKIPVLMAQGGNDTRVVQEQSDKMNEALKAAGADVTYLLYPDTGHGFSSLEYSQDFYSHMEQFFAEHLGGKVDKTPDI